MSKIVAMSQFKKTISKIVRMRNYPTPQNRKHSQCIALKMWTSLTVNPLSGVDNSLFYSSRRHLGIVTAQTPHWGSRWVVFSHVVYLWEQRQLFFFAFLAFQWYFNDISSVKAAVILEKIKLDFLVCRVCLTRFWCDNGAKRMSAIMWRRPNADRVTDHMEALA